MVSSFYPDSLETGVSLGKLYHLKKKDHFFKVMKVYFAVELSFSNFTEHADHLGAC